MKKIYLLIGSLILTTVGFSQITQKAIPLGNTHKSVQSNVVTSHTTAEASERETVWTNTFSDAGDWIIENTGSHDLNWEIGIGLENSGTFTTAPINSVSQDDGYAMLDSDGFGNETTDPGDIENAWVQTANPIDLTGHETVLIEFASQYRKWDQLNGTANLGIENCLLEVSNDGVTWPDVSTYTVEEADPGTRFNVWSHIATGDETANPSFTTFNISEVAGDQASVYIRFRWTGVWGYSWFLDDVEIFTPELENDISVTGTALGNGGFISDETDFTFSAWEVIDGDSVTGFEYYSLPANQRPEFFAASSVLNLGTSNELGVTLTGDFNGNVVTESLDLTSNAGSNELFFGYETAGLANGSYELTWSAEGANPELDENPDNNSLVRNLHVTDFIYAREDAENLAVYPNLDEVPFYKAGAFFEIFEEDEIFGINFLLSDQTEMESEVIGELWTVINGELELIDETDDFLITNETLLNAPGDENLTWATIIFDDGIDVTAGDLILPVVFFEGEEGSVQILTSFTEGRDGGFRNIFEEANADFIWRDTIHTPCVRLNLDPDAEANVLSTDEIAATIGQLGQNTPNPANGSTVINYSTLQSGSVTFEVLDITGKVVFSSYEGNQAAGSYTVELDAAQFNAGVYTYTLTVNGNQLTKKMIIQ